MAHPLYLPMPPIPTDDGSEGIWFARPVPVPTPKQEVPDRALRVRRITQAGAVRVLCSGIVASSS